MQNLMFVVRLSLALTLAWGALSTGPAHAMGKPVPREVAGETRLLELQKGDLIVLKKAFTLPREAVPELPGGPRLPESMDLVTWFSIQDGAVVTGRLSRDMPYCVIQIPVQGENWDPANLGYRYSPTEMPLNRITLQESWRQSDGDRLEGVALVTNEIPFVSIDCHAALSDSRSTKEWNQRTLALTVNDLIAVFGSDLLEVRR